MTGVQTCALPISRTNYGYLYNDKITDKETAKINFSKEINVPVEELQNIEFKFNSYYTKKLVSNRIAKNGNNVCFFEPMFANSLWAYDHANRGIFDHICNVCYGGIDISQSMKDTNESFELIANEVLDMIYFHYHGGSNYDTDFWKYAMKYSSDKLKDSIYLQKAIEICHTYGENQFYTPHRVWSFNTFGLLMISNNLGYDYFRHKFGPSNIEFPNGERSWQAT